GRIPGRLRALELQLELTRLLQRGLGEAIRSGLGTATREGTLTLFGGRGRRELRNHGRHQSIVRRSRDRGSGLLRHGGGRRGLSGGGRGCGGNRTARRRRGV